jgi:hypothetical protein
MQGSTGATDALGRPIFRVVSDTRDKVLAAPCDVVYSGEREPIFPPFLKTHPTPSPLRVVGTSVTWIAPTSVQQLVDIKAEFPNARIIAGERHFGAKRPMLGRESSTISDLRVLLLAAGFPPGRVVVDRQLRDRH